VTSKRETDLASLWGGGFSGGMHPALAALSISLEQDRPLADADLRASAAYARALGRAGILKAPEAERLAAILDDMRAELASGAWRPAEAEDIHAAIEVEVTRRTGDLGARLHTGRSRNDQVATAFRLALHDRAVELGRALHAVQATLIERAAAEVDTLVPAYTHVQRAQPMRLAHWLMAHFWMLERDGERLHAAARHAAVLPLGSGAATGNAFGIDRAWLASQLGFTSITDNSLDAVGDRDFAAEFVFAIALLEVHLSRLAEELVWWSSAEFSFVQWPDGLATGSSLMPNKKNPDLAELVRGRAAAGIGDLTAMLVLLKGLPISYQRDLQDDKPPVWRSAARGAVSLAAMQAALAGIQFDRERMRAALSDDVLATEAADVLVARGIPFRRAHHAVAEAVALARRHGCELRALAGRVPALPEPLQAGDLAALDFETAIERRTAAGGTARAAIAAQIDRGRALLEGRDR
jgi:argininosuccinate lyase